MIEEPIALHNTLLFMSEMMMCRMASVGGQSSIDSDDAATARACSSLSCVLGHQYHAPVLLDTTLNSYSIITKSSLSHHLRSGK